VGTFPRVSLIVVTYRSRDVIGNCLGSALTAAAAASLDLEIILVDNAPGDGSAEAALTVAPGTTIISNDENVGFGRACNQAFEVATGQWWLLLNPDATLAPNALTELVAFAGSDARAAAIAPTLTGAGLDRAESAGMLPGIRSALGHFLLLNRILAGGDTGPWRGLQVRRRPDLGPRQVEWASAGALLLRPEAVREIGGFDESYFLYAEDVDLGRRLGGAGWEIWLLPDATAEHSVAASSGGVSDRWIVALHDDYARHANRMSVALFDLIAAAGLGLRALRAGSDRLHRERMSVGARSAFGLAAHALVHGTAHD
jgi:GT2 family glycosyltransferase